MIADRIIRVFLLASLAATHLLLVTSCGSPHKSSNSPTPEDEKCEGEDEKASTEKFKKYFEVIRSQGSIQPNSDVFPASIAIGLSLEQAARDDSIQLTREQILAFIDGSLSDGSTALKSQFDVEKFQARLRLQTCTNEH